MSGSFKYRVIVSDDHCAGTVLAKQTLYTSLFSNGRGRYLEQRLFLPYDFFIRIVIGFKDVNLFFKLAANLAHYFFAFVDHQGETEYTTDLGRRTAYAFYIDFLP